MGAKPEVGRTGWTFAAFILLLAPACAQTADPGAVPTPQSAEYFIDLPTSGEVPAR